MRVPYIEPAGLEARSTPAEQAIIQRIRDRRFPRPLQPLDLALLHCPPVADGWNSFIGAIRTKTSLPADIREIAICRVAVNNRARYEWDHHAPLAEAAGVSAEGMRTLEASDLPPSTVAENNGLTEMQLAVAVFTDAMTVHVAVPDEIFDGVRRYLTDQEIVELTATVAAYNCVSRFLVALDVGERNSIKPGST